MCVQDDVSLHCSLPVDAATLLQDSSLVSSLPDLTEFLKDQPETSLNCMALALHTVSSSGTFDTRRRRGSVAAKAVL